MCQYIRHRCVLCHTTISFHPVNCGKGMAVQGPTGMQMECPEHDTSGVTEVIKEERVCAECVREGEQADRHDEGWTDWFSWRRKAEEE